MDLKYPR